MMYVVVAHSKLDLTILPYVTYSDGNSKPVKQILSFQEAKKRRRMLNRLNHSCTFTIYGLTYCDQNKEE